MYYAELCHIFNKLIWKFKIRKKNCAIFIVNFYLALFCEHYRDFKVALAVYYSVKTNSVKFYIDKYPKVLWNYTF